MTIEKVHNSLLTYILLFSLLSTSLFIGFIPQGFSILRIAVAVVMFISSFLMVKNYYQNRMYINQLSPYFKSIFILLLLWSIITIFRSISTNSTDMISLFGHYLMGWAWLTPLAIVIGINVLNWPLILRLFGMFSAIGCVFAILSLSLDIKIQFGALEWLYFAPLLLITYQYQTKFIKFITIISTALFAIMSFSVSQRVNFVFLAIILIFLPIEFYRNKTNGMFKRVFFTLFAATVVVFGYLSAENINNYLSKSDQLTTDTRTFIFYELFDDLTSDEIIIGRGALGKYYSPYFESWNKFNEGGDSQIRSVAEVGYLQMILKGGVIMVILIILILVPSAYLGIVKSNNIIAKMSGYYILLYLLLWCISYYPVYSARYIVLWIAAGTCMSFSARQMQNKDIFVRDAVSSDY